MSRFSPFNHRAFGLVPALTLALMLTLPHQSALAKDPPGFDASAIRAQAYVLVKAGSGEEFLRSATAEEPRAVASTQKLLLALMVAELGDLDTGAKVTTSDTKVEGSRLGLKAGETYPRRLLLQALMVKSANDIANVLAREAALGDDFGYVKRANARARELGCTNTRLRNAHGLTVAGQYSTAADLARIAIAAYAQPDLRPMMATWDMDFPLASGGEPVKLTNTNKLLQRMPACNGMKTGMTRAAGHCLVASASAGGLDLIAVVLGSTEDRVIDDAEALLTWGFAQNGIDPAPAKAIPVAKPGAPSEPAAP